MFPSAMSDIINDAATNQSCCRLAPNFKNLRLHWQAATERQAAVKRKFRDRHFPSMPHSTLYTQYMCVQCTCLTIICSTASTRISAL